VLNLQILLLLLLYKQHNLGYLNWT